MTLEAAGKAALKVLAAVSQRKKESGDGCLKSILIGLLVVFFLPVLVVTSLFAGGVEADQEDLDSKVDEMSFLEKAILTGIGASMELLGDAIDDAGLTSDQRIQAEMLYYLVLAEEPEDEETIDKLIACFTDEEMDDEELIGEVNDAFDLELDAGQYSRVMEHLRSTAIDTSGYTDPGTKNNLDLVVWAREAQKHRWGYVWGTYGRILTNNLWEAKLRQYPDELGQYESFVLMNWLGRRTVDCVGLIKGYEWLNTETGEILYQSNGFHDWDANMIYRNAQVKGDMSTMPETPGIGLWKEGHVGIYIGDGTVIEARGTLSGVVETTLNPSGWSGWFEVPGLVYITVPEETEPVTEPATEPVTEPGV